VKRPTILLFDVDGTLLTTVGVGRRALERAFASRYGDAAGLRDVGFNGMTDHAIVRAGLAAAGRTASVAEIEGVLATYVDYLEDEVTRAEGLASHPGVVELLDAAAARPLVAVGLGTGNIRAGARVKLGRVGLFGRFQFGGFGCDHEDRAELLRIGAARGAAVLGRGVDACRVVVIGDTPLDIAAARTIGAASLGVGTSDFTSAALRAAGADAAVDDLTDPEARRHLLDR